MIELLSPGWLAAGLALAALAALLMPRGPARGARALSLGLIGVALGAPVLTLRKDNLHHIIFVEADDEGARASAAAQLEALRADRADEGSLIVIGVDERPQVWPDPAAAPPPSPGAPRWREALALAAALAPPTGALHVERWGQAGADPDPALLPPSLAQAGLGHRALGAVDADPDATLTLAGDRTALAGGTLRVDLGRSREGAATLWLIDGAGAPWPLGDAPPAAGPVQLELPLPAAAAPGAAAIELRAAEGPALRRSLLLRAPPKVWLLSGDRGEGAALEQRLTAEGALVQTLDPRGLDAAGPPSGPGLVVLGGVGAPRLSAAAQEGLARWVEGGGHLVMTGGAEGWERGGWEAAPLAPALPLRPAPEGATLDPAVTLIVVLDTSGSMARQANFGPSDMAGAVSARMSGGRPEGSRIRLAAEGVVQAIERLREDTDQIAVLGVDTQARWHISLRGLRDKAELQRLARSLSSGGGGIYLTTALEAVEPVAAQATTPLRHVILFADAGDVGEQSRSGGRSADEIVAGLRRRGVTVSVVGIGTAADRDAAYLKQLAVIGGGQATLAEDPRRLPALFARETERLLSAAPPTTMSLPVRARRWTPALAGISLAGAPPLPGHHKLEAQRGAAIHLETDRGPVLAGWRRGAGQVWALATDLGAATARPWSRWEGWGALWVNLLRLSEGAGAGGPVALSLAVDPLAPDRHRVELIERDALGQSRAPFSRSLRVERLLPGAPAAPWADALPMTLTAPGAWEASALLPEDSVLRLIPSEPDGTDGEAVLWVSPPAAPTPRAPGGDWSRPLGPRPAAPRRLSLWPLFAAASALALIGDAWARRRSAARP
ncbi:MAG: hypothetical protein RL071_64 [Pseudomonadota bacterium]